MKGLIGEYIEQLHIERIRHRKVSAWTIALALLVVSCVVWGLRVRGISLTNDTDCGIEEHIHSASCYELIEICGMNIGDLEENGKTHMHKDNCYESVLACEKLEHVHTVACLNIEKNDANGADTEVIVEIPGDISNLNNSEMMPESEETRLIGDENGGQLSDEEESELSEEEIEELDETESEIALMAAPDPADSVNLDYYADYIRYVIANMDEEPIHYGEFYVLTATGLRWADKINEYLPAANGDVDGENSINSRTPGVYFEETIDGNTSYYLRNAGWPKEKDTPDGVNYPDSFRENYNQYRYLLYPDDDLTLVIFRTNEQRTEEHQGYTGNWIYTDGGEGETLRTGAFMLDGSLGDDMNDGVYGTDVIITTVSAGTSDGDFGNFCFDKITGDNDGDMNNRWGDSRYESFYTKLLAPSEGSYTHSDIEIADGGFFKVSTRKTFDDGSYEIVKTHYDSYVNDIKYCDILNKEGNRIVLYDNSDPDPNNKIYEEVNNEGEKTQKELTSQYYCAYRSQYHFDVADVGSVKFSLAIMLAPTKSTIETYSQDGTLLNEQTVSLLDENGDYSYELQWIDVELGRQSVIDAINKCPDHTGMDFNLNYMEVDFETIRPVFSDFGLTKQTTGESINPSQFRFKISETDSDFTNVGTVYEVSADLEGNINFPEIEFVRPGKYYYRAEEIIPDDAVEIEHNVYYKDYVRYDGRKIDIVFDVEVQPSMIAVVQGTSPESELKVTPHYYVDGEEIRLKDDEGADILEGQEQLVFNNEAINHKEKDIEVKKVWLGDATHDDDNITFRIIQTKNGAETSYYDVAGETVFELNKSNGWYMSFENLPIILGADSYSYEIQETQMIEYVPSYSKKETDTLISWTISNTKNQDRYLHFEKKWTDDEGNEIEAPEGVDNVHIKLRRQYQEKEIILYVKVQSTDGGDEYTDLFELPAYKGGKVEFQLESTPGNYQELAIANTVNCTCSIDDNRVYTVEINDYNPEITLRYRPVTDSDLRLWHTNSSGFRSSESSYNTWNSFGTGSSDTTRDLKDCWVTVYTNTETFSSGYKLINRVNNYAAAELKLNPSVYQGGQYYSFNAYVRYQKEFTTPVVGDVVERTTSITSTPTMLKMQLKFNRPGEGSEWIDIATVPGYEEGTPPSQNVWYQLNNVSFRIPDNCENLALTITAVEPNNADNQYVDLYFDDVIIAPGMIKTDVNKNTGRLEAVRLYNVVNESHTIPSEAMTWQEDVESGENIYSFTIEKDSDWTKSLQISSFGTDGKGVPELPDRNYRYYIVEEFGDDERDKIIVDYYKVFYYDDYVAHNTAETPIIVENQYHAYVLPNTGGIGSNKIRWLGLLILLAGIPPALVNLVRKRGRPSG